MPRATPQSMLELAKQHGVRDATVIVIEATPASEMQRPAPDEELPGLLEQVDTAVQALASVGKMLWSEFRTPFAYEQNGHERSARRGSAVIPEVGETAPEDISPLAPEPPL